MYERLRGEGTVSAADILAEAGFAEREQRAAEHGEELPASKATEIHSGASL